MEFKLKTPIEIMDMSTRAMEYCDTIKVKYKGEDGLMVLLRIQDVIMKSFQNVKTNSSDNTANPKDSKGDSEITASALLSMISLTGAESVIYGMIADSLTNYAEIGTHLLVKRLRNNMELEDLHSLCTEVVKSFLLPRLIQRLSNTNS